MIDTWRSSVDSPSLPRSYGEASEIGDESGLRLLLPIEHLEQAPGPVVQEIMVHLLRIGR